jgi:DNA polymerase-2
MNSAAWSACKVRGYIVHSYAENRHDRLYLLGRLEDGRSFVVCEAHWRPYIHIYEDDRDKAEALIGDLKHKTERAVLESFEGGKKLLRLDFSHYSDRFNSANNLERNGIPSPDAGIKAPDLYLLEKNIHGPVMIQGEARPGKSVDVVIQNPVLTPPGSGSEGETIRPDVKVRFSIASIDIETDTRDNSLRAVSISISCDIAEDGEPRCEGLVRVLGNAQDADKSSGHVPLFFHPNEESLLRAFLDDIRRFDPDILTGWNFLDFDFRILSERCERLGIPFTMGRSRDPSKFFPGERDAADSGLLPSWRKRSAAAVVNGRQVIDALRIVRSGSWGSSGGIRSEAPVDFTLESVSQSVLGEGKLVKESGEEKIAALDKLYAENPRLFGEYCYRDACLVLRILAKTGLFALTVERARLTGVTLDKAWTSVVSFERVYGMELRQRHVAPPVPDQERDVSGAAGGTVLDPQPGLFSNVAIFDFRSLYPTIMRTFNIDPLSHARVGAVPETERGELPIQPQVTDRDISVITAPNGACFSREPGILPQLIAGYFSARRKALDSGNDTAARVYKILMNSFYGVLGTASCLYGRTELAGSITGFARKWLLLSRDWFTGRGYPVLYGDTDSLFVETGFGDSASYSDFAARCGELTVELNRFLTETIRAEYDLESFIELRFEKACRRLLIPPLRGPSAADDETPRGRAKGYGAYIVEPENGNCTVEVKGMEAVRSDATVLARKLQVELLELVFITATDPGRQTGSAGSADKGEAVFKEKIRETIAALRSGKFDGDLVYRKRLSRPPESYTSSTPPQVKAARALGWKNRRGTVEYVWTAQGAEPASLPHEPLDYDHYINSQVLPVALSIAAACRWNMDEFFVKGKGLHEGQMELGL